ncbi:LacI family DNA-binding transcriptional regulator [Sanguibacter sp. A247]|uniref:LacI family DNA-binding transcriptional regulator n=1 Tax=unclassified Sanguibacter TaxID=2645534 RepID=UPI003FD83892
MRSTGRVTIGDVAQRAGVSVATVSKVINARYGVSPSTIERVQKVIDELGYESSLIARSLRGQRTNVIGILVAEFEPFSTEILKGASDAARGTGYELLAFSGALGGADAAGRTGWERRSLARLAGTLIDGAILVTPTVVDPGQAIPVVSIDPHEGRDGPPTVDSDNLAGARLATEHLLALGHRRIGFLAGRSDLESARLREQGYREALAAAGVAFDPALVRVGSYRAEQSSAPAHELLTGPGRPTAVFAANDLSALRTIEVARELGLRVPEDVSVIGFDDVPEAAAAQPPLTTVAQPLHRMGAEALRLIIDLLEGREREATDVRLPTKLVERGTTAALDGDAA